MKVILLRHEQRDIEDASFHSPLTDEGACAAAVGVCAQLKQYVDVSYIYTSPFCDASRPSFHSATVTQCT